jgi:hypothetical protein
LACPPCAQSGAQNADAPRPPGRAPAVQALLAKLVRRTDEALPRPTHIRKPRSVQRAGSRQDQIRRRQQEQISRLVRWAADTSPHFSINLAHPGGIARRWGLRLLIWRATERVRRQDVARGIVPLFHDESMINRECGPAPAPRLYAAAAAPHTPCPAHEKKSDGAPRGPDGGRRPRPSSSPHRTSTPSQQTRSATRLPSHRFHHRSPLP